LDGDFVRPGGAVGLLLVVAVVGLPGVVVGDPVVGVVGATVVGGTVGTTVGVTLGVVGVLVGSEFGVLVDSGDAVVSLGRTDCTASGAGVMTGRGAGLAASGSGTSGVSRLGPPSRLLTRRIR
jgi:hypothetical protein